MRESQPVSSSPESRDASCELPIPENLPETKGIPALVWLLMVPLLLWGATTANALITVTALFCLPVCVALLWKTGEPPVLPFAIAMQWLQVTAAIFYCNQLGLTLTSAADSFEFEKASWLSLISLIMLAIGIRITSVGRLYSHYPVLVEEAERVDVMRLFYAYLLSFALSAVLTAIAFRVPALTQLLFGLTSIKWVFVFMLGFTALTIRRGYVVLLVTVVLEFGTGIIGFFSGFKSVFFVLMVVILTSPSAFRGKRLLLTVSTAVLILIFGIVWTAVKGDYRDFLNQDTKTQEVLVPVPQRIEKLGQLVTDLTWPQVVDAFDDMVLRISYVQFFAKALENVPSNVPHENGALWLGALKHIVTPRFLFPNKAVLDDSERTSLYTGIEVAGLERGTSIGIGYIGESYIDFGVPGMFVPILLLGAFYGLIYRWFVDYAVNKMLGAGIACAILIFTAYTIETSNIKLVGGAVSVVLILGLLYRAFGAKLMLNLSKPNA